MQELYDVIKRTVEPYGVRVHMLGKAKCTLKEINVHDRNLYMRVRQVLRQAMYMEGLAVDFTAVDADTVRFTYWKKASI